MHIDSAEPNPVEIVSIHNLENVCVSRGRQHGQSVERLNEIGPTPDVANSELGDNQRMGRNLARVEFGYKSSLGGVEMIDPH